MRLNFCSLSMLSVKLNDQPPNHTLYPEDRGSEHFCPGIDLRFFLVQLPHDEYLGVEAQRGESFFKYLRCTLYVTNDHSLSDLGAHDIPFQLQ